MAKMTKLVAFAVLGLLCVTSARAAANPECKGLEALASHLESLANSTKFGSISIKSVVQQFNCHVFGNCSGLWCAGISLNNNFNASLYLEHCDNPIKVLMHLKVPNKKIDEWRVFENGKVVEFEIPTPLPIPVSGKITPSLRKEGDNIALGFRACLHSLIISNPFCKQLQATSVQVSSSECATQKPGPTTMTKVKPETKPTILMTTKLHRTTKKSAAATTKQSSISKGKSQKKTSKAQPTTQAKPTLSRTAADTSKKVSSTEIKPSATGKAHTPVHKGKHHGSQHSGSTKLSTGAKVAIVASVILVCLLIVGLLAYWRRLKKRGPMYYNDIFVNREMHDNFDDEEPLFDSHLVL